MSVTINTDVAGGGTSSGGPVSASAVVAAINDMSSAQVQDVRKDLITMSYRPAANTAARLAIAELELEPGAMVREADTGLTYRYLSSPPSTSGNWERVVVAAEVLAAAVSTASDLTTGDTTLAPSRSAVTTAIAAALASGGGNGQIRVYGNQIALASRTVATAAAADQIIGRVTIPGSANLNRTIEVTWELLKTGTANTLSGGSIRIGAVGTTVAASTNMNSYGTMLTAAQAGRRLKFGLRGNGADTANLRVLWGETPNGSYTPTDASTATVTLSTATDFDIIIVAPAGLAADTFAIGQMEAEVRDPDAAAGGGASTPDPLYVAVGDETTAITTGTGKVTFRNVGAKTLSSVRASLTTASSSGAVTVDVNVGGSTILSTKLTIDATEKTSTTAAAPAVISASSFADDAEVTIDIDGAGTGAAGLKVTFVWA